MRIAGAFLTRRSRETPLDLNQRRLRSSVLHRKKDGVWCFQPPCFLYVMFSIMKIASSCPLITACTHCEDPEGYVICKYKEVRITSSRGPHANLPTREPSDARPCRADETRTFVSSGRHVGERVSRLPTTRFPFVPLIPAPK